VDEALQAAQDAVIRGDDVALERLLGEHPHLVDQAVDARTIIAREHQFASWDDYLVHRDGPFEDAVEAIVAGDAETLRRLLREHPELIRARSPRKHRSTLLHYVGANGVEDFRQKTPPNAVEIARILADAGAEIDAVADMYGGSTTLGLVATSCHPLDAGVQPELIDFFLERGAEIDHSIVNSCLANGRPAAAEHLARRGATLDLEGAAGIGRLDRVQELFDVATPDQIQSGLQWACEYGHTPVVEFLLSRGVAVDRMHRGQTPLHWAAYAGRTDIVRLLLARGAPRDLRDERWSATPLGWAEHGAEHPPGTDTKCGDHEEVLRQLRALS
jgi:Ankyrin repeats (3 copies)